MEPVPGENQNIQDQTTPDQSGIQNATGTQIPKPETAVVATPKPKRAKNVLFIIFILLLIISIAAVIGYYFLKNSDKSPTDKEQSKPTPTPITQSKSVEIITFKSDADFKDYLTQATSGYEMYTDANISRLDVPAAEDSVALNAPQAGGSFGAALERVSETNVQVGGIDEADIVKTDGKNIYYSPLTFGYRLSPQPLLEEGVSQPEYIKPETKILEAFPPENLKSINSIGETGEMLLINKTLAIFSGNKISAYNINNPSLPTNMWSVELDKNSQIVTSRLLNENIYLVTKTRINTYEPCPVKVFTDTLSVKCTDIYRPEITMPADSVYSIIKIDPETGKVDKKTSIIGSDSASVVYMSQNAAYITYTISENFMDIYIDFFTEGMNDVFPQDMVSRMKEIKEYNISFEAKMVEFSQVFEDYVASLSEEEETKIQEDMMERMEKYLRERARDITKTGIAKVDINDFTLGSTALLPGMPLNQFSLDEYQGYLRFATTVGTGIFGSSETSANDVYILDNGLRIVGQILGLGLTERIYSARFIADKGYVVTFRQIDPFYVLDLSDPTNPQLKGELKIPGYSSYLHPINKDKIVGIGKEGSNVKVSLFDVTNPENPTEANKLILEEYWSDTLNTHHAFLIDEKHQVFFMPAGSNGYIIGYSNDNLSIKTTVKDVGARRAVYMNDFLYILGDNKVVVLNENNWEEVNQLTF